MFRATLDCLDSDPFGVKSVVQLLTLVRVLICDQLHSAIMAYLAGVYLYVWINTLDVAFELSIYVEESFGFKG